MLSHQLAPRVPRQDSFINNAMQIWDTQCKFERHHIAGQSQNIGAPSLPSTNTLGSKGAKAIAPAVDINYSDPSSAQLAGQAASRALHDHSATIISSAETSASQPQQAQTPLHLLDDDWHVPRCVLLVQSPVLDQKEQPSLPS